MLTALLFACLVQDTETIPRTHRDGYQAALVDYDRAVSLAESDPRLALQLIDRLFDNKKIEKKDRRLVFERLAGQVSKAFDFFPNQARGRIRLILAKTDSENAASLIAGAVADLKSSVDAGV